LIFDHFYVTTQVPQLEVFEVQLLYQKLKPFLLLFVYILELVADVFLLDFYKRQVLVELVDDLNVLLTEVLKRIEVSSGDF
jgi:hypothetical protein